MDGFVYKIHCQNVTNRPLLRIFVNSCAGLNPLDHESDHPKSIRAFSRLSPNNR